MAVAEGQRERRRVVVVVTEPSGYEGDFVHGAVDFNEHAHHWRFAGPGGLPYARFGEVDLDEVDGIIVPVYERWWADEIKRSGTPAVAVASLFDDLPLPLVTFDDVAIGRLGAEHLLERGFTQFGFVGQGEWAYSKSRLDGFRRLVKDEARRECYIHLASPHKGHEDQSLIQHWLAQLPKPIGVMAANDGLAVQVISCGVQSGLRVPDDVAVLGVDNFVWLAATSAVPLSSIVPDCRRIGYCAAELLDGLMNGEAPPHAHQFLPPVGVVTRRSTDVTLARDPLISKAMAYIRDHFADRINVEDVLEHVQLSRTSLETKMKSAFGYTPHTAICRVRVNHAKKLLVAGDASIDEIARACGLPRQSQLSTLFRRLSGMTPGQYRQGKRSGEKRNTDADR